MVNMARARLTNMLPPSSDLHSLVSSISWGNLCAPVLAPSALEQPEESGERE